MLKFGAKHQHGARAMTLMVNEIMNNVSQQVMRGKKATQSKGLIYSNIRGKF
jgi:hypothetical protein